MKVYFFISFFIFWGCSKPTFKTYLSEMVADRKGNPGLFLLNGKEYSASNFRKELYYERKHFQNEFTHPLPQDIQAKMEEYIEETVLLEEILSKSDLQSQELKRYLWPFIRKGLISYYLEKESGGYDLIENYSDLKIPDEMINDFIKKNPGKFEDNESSKEKLKIAMRDVKWKKLYEDSKEKKKIVIGRMKEQNKVKIIPGEIYKLEE